MQTQIPRPKSKPVFLTLVGLSTAILLVTPVLVLTGVGYVVDKIFHTQPLLTFVCLFLGFISGIYNVYKLLKSVTKMK